MSKHRHDTRGSVALSRALWLLALVGLMLAFALPADSQAGGELQESFDDALLPGWEHSPEAVVTDGQLHIGPAQFAAPMGAWRDYDLSFSLRMSGEGETHIATRATDSGSYQLTLGPEGASLLKTVPGGEPTSLAEGGSPVGTETTLSLQIVLREGELTISVDGQTLLSATDPEPLGPGGIVFASIGGRTSIIDDLMLQPAAGAPEPAVPVVAREEPTAEPAAGASDALSWQDLIRGLSASQGGGFQTDVFVVNLLLAVATSWVLSRVYILWGTSLSNRRKFAGSFMLVTVTTTFIILVVRSSVALSLGLVGALSIIRFRTAVKDPEELAYMFFAIGLGIGLGDNQRAVTLITLAVVILTIGLSRLL
ncbi:MAG: DUF4956 domain-containing protein, partial [Anaerolineae bacterium]